MKKNDYKVIKRLDYKQPDFTALEIELTFKLADEFTEVTSVTHYKRLTTDRKAPLVLDGEDLEEKTITVADIQFYMVDNETRAYITDTQNNRYKITLTSENENILAFIKPQDRIKIAYVYHEDVSLIQTIE